MSESINGFTDTPKIDGIESSVTALATLAPSRHTLEQALIGTDYTLIDTEEGTILARPPKEDDQAIIEYEGSNLTPLAAITRPDSEPDLTEIDRHLSIIGKRDPDLRARLEAAISQETFAKEVF